MIRVAFQTLRTRWVSFLGTIVALVLGVAQVAAMGVLLMTMLDLPDRPVERFADAPAVVQASDPEWNPAHHDLGVRSLADAHGISDELSEKVAATGETVVDRAFYAQLKGGPEDQVGHPWPVARFGGYELVDGKEPSDAKDVVVASGQAHTGDKVTVLTASGVEQYTVSGTVDPVGWEDAVFFTDKEAARLSPVSSPWWRSARWPMCGPPSATTPRCSPARTATRWTPARPVTARPWTTPSRWSR